MENIDISFAPDTSADSEKRIEDIENYLALLCTRLRFCLENIVEEYSARQDESKDTELILSALSDGVGEFTNADKNCEIFNDYSENIAQSYFSHAEGCKTSATAPYAHAEGHGTQATAPSAHAEGDESKATNNYAHAEGKNTQAAGYASHAEGENTVASGWLSHAEGKDTVADGMYTHAGGMDSHSLGIATFAHGKGANAHGDSSAVFGKYNATVNYPFVVGIGYADNNRIDGLALDWDGNLRIAGRISADGGVEIDLSEYLRSDEIADWAKADSKPKYTASEVGAAAESHTHTVSEITDMPDWAKSAVKPEYTAAEVGAATSDDIKAAIDDIEIGGSNLLLNTKSFSSASSTALSGALLGGSAGISGEKYRGLSVRGGAVSDSQSVVCRYGFKNFDLGETFTFSFFARGNVPEIRVYFYGDTGYVQVAKCTNSQGETNANVDGRCSFSVTDSWKKYRVTWTLKTTGDTSIAKWILIRTYNSTIGQEIYVCGCKLENGSKATDWSPAPDDVLCLEERVTALEAAILSGGEG
ncbi:MAG: hypothetical protein ACI4JI_03250 [Ruminiclostridium sp.]